ILLPNSDEWLQKLDGFNVKLHRSIKTLLHQKKAHLEHLADFFREEELPS
ncbi:exonuclease VII large subunit, partial [Helicobacter pylori]